jgi:hypothetical protein
VVSHGVPGELLDAVREARLAFFRAPMGDRLRFSCDPARGTIVEGYDNDDFMLDWCDYFDHHTPPALSHMTVLPHLSSTLVDLEELVDWVELAAHHPPWGLPSLHLGDGAW